MLNSDTARLLVGTPTFPSRLNDQTKLLVKRLVKPISPMLYSLDWAGYVDLPCAAVEIQNALAVCRLLCVWALPTARTDNAMHASKNHTQATDTGARRL